MESSGLSRWCARLDLPEDLNEVTHQAYYDTNLERLRYYNVFSDSVLNVIADNSLWDDDITWAAIGNSNLDVARYAAGAGRFARYYRGVHVSCLAYRLFSGAL